MNQDETDEGEVEPKEDTEVQVINLKNLRKINF